MYLYKFDERDPLIQLVLWSAVVAVGLGLATAVLLEILVPELSRALAVPSCVAIFCGTLAFLIEAKQKRYICALLGVFLAIALFPGGAFILLKLLDVPFQSKAASFVALIPQAISPEFCYIFWKRFKASSGQFGHSLPDKHPANAPHPH